MLRCASWLFVLLALRLTKRGPRARSCAAGRTERSVTLWSGFWLRLFVKPPSIWRVPAVSAAGLPSDDNGVVAQEEGDRARDLNRLDVSGQLRTDKLRKTSPAGCPASLP